jgi:hypothetical protein
MNRLHRYVIFLTQSYLELNPEVLILNHGTPV